MAAVLFGCAQKVDRTAKTGDFLRANPISLTPGFSQVKRRQAGLGNRLNGFPSLSTLSITRLKPGVNGKLDLNVLCEPALFIFIFQFSLIFPQTPGVS
jgi:hypothetical protein